MVHPLQYWDATRLFNNSCFIFYTFPRSNSKLNTFLVEQGWQLESCKVFNHLLWCHHFFINIFHITIATPYPNCKPSTFWRRLSQVSSVPLNDISLFNAFKFKYFLLRKVKHIPAKQWFLCYCETLKRIKSFREVFHNAHDPQKRSLTTARIIGREKRNIRSSWRFPGFLRLFTAAQEKENHKKFFANTSIFNRISKKI